MTKHLLTTTAVALLALAGTAQAEGTAHTTRADEAGVGTVISGTANAAYEKAAQGVNSVRKDYHEAMADSNAEAARENLKDGNYAAAAEDARDAAVHQADANAAAHDAKASKDKASASWSKAKKAAE